MPAAGGNASAQCWFGGTAVAATLSEAGLGAPALLGVKAKELQLIGAIAACYLFLFTANDKSIHEHLVNLAELQFLLFVLFRRNGTSFLPGQNYSNTSSMIRAKFKSVALPTRGRTPINSDLTLS